MGSQCQGEKMVTDAICPFSMTCGREEMVTGSPAGQLCVHTQGGRVYLEDEVPMPIAL